MDKSCFWSFIWIETHASFDILIEWTNKQAVPFSVWYGLIKKNFESMFFVSEKYSKVTAGDPHPELINKKNIYKDSLNASHNWADYQLRPNFTITMVVVSYYFFEFKNFIV